MPFFDYECRECGSTREVLVKSSNVKEVECNDCEKGTAVKVNRYKVNAVGLPNGFSSTRNRTKEHKPRDI